MGAKRKPKAATKHAQQVSGLQRTSVARSPTKRELSVVLRRLEECLIYFPGIKTSTPLKSTAAVVAPRLPDFSESESLSDEHEPQTKIQKLRKPKHTFMDDILTTKSDAVRGRRNGAGTALAAREDVHPSGASEGDDSSYRPPSETGTELTSHESSSEWEEFTSDSTSSTSTEISNRPSSRMSTRAKRNVNGGTSSGRRLQRLRLQSSRSKSDNIRARASGQAHPRRPATGEELSDRDDGKFKRQQKNDTSRTKRKPALERRLGATKKQVPHSSGVKNISRNLKIVEQKSSSSWEESSSVTSMEDTESLTNSRDRRTQLRSVKQKQHARPLFNDRRKMCHRLTNSKAAATRREGSPRRSSRSSVRDSECSQEKDTAQSVKGPLSTNREGSQHMTKMSKTLGSKRKHESSNSGSRKSEAATQPKDSESLRSGAKNLQTRSPAEPHGGYADRRKSLQARRESILYSQYSSDSPDDSDDEPSHLQRNAMSQSSKADIPSKRLSVNGCRIRLARKSTKVLSEQESASSDSFEGWLPVQSQRSKWEESECSSGNEQRKSGSPLRRGRSSDFITLQAGKSQVARSMHVGAKKKNAALSGSSSLLDESSDDLEVSKENDRVRRCSRNKNTCPRRCRAQPARLARRQDIDTKEQRMRDSDRSEEQTTLDLESEVPKIFVEGKLPRTGNVHSQVRSRKPENKISRIKGEDEISHDATTSLEGSGDDVPFFQIKDVTKPQSRQPAARKQTKLQAFVVGADKKGRSRSPLLAGKHGESSHDHSSNSQESGDSSGNNWKSGIVQRSTRGVSSTHTGPKESRAHSMRLTKMMSIKRKRHPSSSSGHSIEEGLTTEPETCRSSRDPRAKSLTSKQRPLKSRIGATQDKENPVTRRSSLRTERDNNFTARKQPQTVVVQVRSRPRGSSAVGREATPPALISGTTDSSRKLSYSRKNKVAQSKAVLGEQRGLQENSAELKVITRARKKNAKGRSRSSTEELVTSELESEGDEGGLRVHSPGPEPRPVQPKTDFTKAGRKCMTGGGPVRAKYDDESLRGSLSLSEVGSDGSGHLKKKASTQSQTENLPARNRLRQRTAIPVKGVRAARSSVVATGRTPSPFLSGPVHNDNHLEQSQKKLDVRPSKKVTLSKTFARPVNVVSKTIFSKGRRSSTRQAPATATKSRTVPTDQRKLQAQPAVHEKHAPQDGTEEMEVAQGRLTRGQLIKARSESMSSHGSLHTLKDGEIKQSRRRTPTLIAKNKVAKREHTANQVRCVSDTNKETELNKTPKRSECAAPHKPRRTTSKELGKAQLIATMPSRSRSTIERGQLQSIPNSSAAGNHSSPVKTMGQNANSKGDSKKIVTRNARSRVQMQTSSSATHDAKTKRGTRQKNTLAEKRSTSGKHTTVTKELSFSSPSAVNSSNRSTHLQEETRTRSSERVPKKRDLVSGTSGTLPEKAEGSWLTAANQQKETKKKAGSSSAAGKSADLRVEKEKEAALKVVSQPKHSDGPNKQHEMDLAAGTSPAKVGKSVVGAPQEKQTPWKPKMRQCLGANGASEQVSSASRPRRKCTTERRKKAAALQKRDQGTAQKQRTQTASKNTAKSVLEMGGTITRSKKQSQTAGKTKGPIQRKVRVLIAAKLRGKKTSQGKFAQPVKKPNSRTDSNKLYSVSRRENAATPVNQRRLRASKERNEKPPSVNQATERCSSITGPKAQHKTVGDRSSSAGILLTTSTASKRTKAAARRTPAPFLRKIEPSLATAAVTAGKGTLKRKRQLRKVAEALAAAAAPSDDIYGSLVPSPKRMISDFLFRKDPREAAEDSLMVAGMRTPQLGSFCGSPWKNSPVVSPCSATSSPFRAAEEIVHAIEKQTSAPYTSSTPKAKQKSHGVVKNLLGNLNELERHLRTVKEKEDRLADLDVELDYFSEDSSAL